MQDTFLVLTRAAKRYRSSDAQFSTYLYGIVRNLTRRRLRRESRAWSLRSWGGGLWATHEPSTEQSLVDQATAQQTVERVRRAVLSLPARYREVVVLCDLHGRNYADTAAVIGCPVGTIRSRLHRGRDLLREKLGQAKYTDDPVRGALDALAAADESRHARPWVKQAVLDAFARHWPSILARSPRLSGSSQQER